MEQVGLVTAWLFRQVVKPKLLVLPAVVLEDFLETSLVLN